MRKNLLYISLFVLITSFPITTHAVPWCHYGTKVTLPIGGQTIDWNGTQLQNYIDNNNIQCGNNGSPHYQQSCLASAATQHYCQSTYGYTVTPPQNFYGEVKTAWRPPNGGYQYNIQSGITFQCTLCNDGRPIPGTAVIDPILPDLNPLPTPNPGNPVPGEPRPLPGKNKGMTWQKKGTEPVSGIVTVGCKGTLPDCDPRQGDTQCSTSLPVLCINKLGAAKPAWVNNNSPYSKWSGGVIATTQPIAPSAANLNTLNAVNQHCKNSFGNDWQVAGHHDGIGGSGWGLQAYGNVGTQKKRFWVNIRDQANGNCWTQ